MASARELFWDRPGEVVGILVSTQLRIIWPGTDFKVDLIHCAQQFEFRATIAFLGKAGHEVHVEQAVDLDRAFDTDDLNVLKLTDETIARIALLLG